MDWTIVVSVLVALLLWVLVMASMAAVAVVAVVTVLRGRSQQAMAGMMSACMSHFQSMMADLQTDKAQAWPGEEVHGAAPCVGAPTGKEAEQHVARW